MTSACVVIGASGGIGRAVTTHLVASGRTVYAFARHAAEVPGALTTAPIDLMDEGSIRRAADTIASTVRLDLVVVATGILKQPGIVPEKTVRAIEADALSRLFAVNAIGPALVAKHFLPRMLREGRSVFAALSARVGSIGDNRLGGWYGYRASKAALNQILRTLAIEARRTHPDAIVLGLHPGTVATALSGPFRSPDADGVVDPETAAANLLRVIEGAKPRQSGQVLDWAGNRVVP